MRKFWIDALLKIAHPVLQAAANDNLKARMPVENTQRKDFQYLEALGRLFCGMSAWLNLSDIKDKKEQENQEICRVLMIKSLSNLVNPKAKDYVDFAQHSQALVDAAYLSQGFLRAPKVWEALQPEVKSQLLFEIKKTRQFKPPKNNWLLFAAMVEAFLLEYDSSVVKKRLYKGVNTFVYKYYIGDGFYGDGEHFAMDHYNSYVIHPMLTDILHIMVKHNLKNAEKLKNKHIPRFNRYLQIQERLIAPEGTYPVLGRTLICRFGVFHALAQAAFLQKLPKQLNNSQVRCALNAVLKQHMQAKKNWDKNNFLTIGFNGSQTEMAEHYVSSGSAYHCATFFLPLGLPETHKFWTAEDEDWTSLKAFSGKPFPADHAYIELTKKQKYIMPWVYRGISGIQKIKALFK